MKYTLDRFEEGFALLEQEDRTFLQIPRTNLPEDAQEGSVLILRDGVWVADPEETEKTAQRIRTKMDLLWQ